MSGALIASIANEIHDDVTTDFWNVHGAIRHKKEREEHYEREDNAYQRRVKDLHAAGINPLLAAGTPAQTTAISAQSANASGGSQSIPAAALADSQIKKNRSETNAQNAMAAKLLSDKDLNKVTEAKVIAESDLLRGQESMIEVEKDYRWQQKKLIDSNIMLGKSQLATDAKTRQKIGKEIGKINAEWNNLTNEFQKGGIELDRMLKVDEFIKKYPKLGTLYLLLGPTGSGMAIHGATKSGGEILKTLLEMLPANLFKKKNPIGFGRR